MHIILELNVQPLTALELHSQSVIFRWVLHKNCQHIPC